MNGQDDLNRLHGFSGFNAGYVIELYERFMRDPSSVDPATRDAFLKWRRRASGTAAALESPAPEGEPPSAVALMPSAEPIPALLLRSVCAAANLAQSLRAYGHLAARLGPAGAEAEGDPSLTFQYHGLSERDLSELPAWVVGGPAAEGCRSALQAVRRLREIYCGSTGFDFEHVHDPRKRTWLREAAESI